MFNLPALSLKPVQLRLMVALSETGKMQSAADRLGIAQPVASRALAEIEAMAGTPLFSRHPKGMTITLAGQTVANKATAILREVYDLESDLTHIKEGLAGKIRIGSVTAPTVKFVVPAIKEIKRRAAKLEISVEVAPSRRLLRELIAGRLDLALARVLPEFDSRQFEITPLGDEKVVFLVRKSHPLAETKNVKLEDVHELEWIVQEKDNPIREAVGAAFHLGGLSEPTDVINSSSFLFALSYLSETDAMLAVTHELAELLIQEPIKASFAQLDMNHPISMSPYFLVRYKSHAISPATQLLKTHILECAALG